MQQSGAVHDIADLSGISTLRGRHNAQNAAAAIAACRAIGLSEAEIRAGLATFPGLKHRMQPVARRGRVVFVNDSKATNAEAAAPALQSFEPIYWIAGGLAKEGGIAALEPHFPTHRQGLSDRRSGSRNLRQASASGRRSRFPARWIVRWRMRRGMRARIEAEMPAVLLVTRLRQF
jgi:hypothetical protein